MGNLSDLERLYLTDNQLSSLPAEIGNLSYLNVLYLDYNQLSSLPAEITNLTSMTKLSVGNNCLAISDPQIIDYLEAHSPDWRDTQRPSCN